MNTSVVGPESENWLEIIREKFYKEKDVGLLGISINGYDNSKRKFIRDKFDPHIQSFFLFSTTNIIEQGYH